MRIAHLILSSRFAGSERHALELAALQAAAGHEVRLVMRRKAARESPDAIAHRVDPAVGVELVDDWLFRWPARRQATAFVRGWRPDVAHAHLGSACRSLHPLAGHCLRVATLHIAYKPRQHAALDGLVAIAPWQLDAIPPALRANSVQIDNWTHPAPPAPTPGRSCAPPTASRPTPSCSAPWAGSRTARAWTCWWRPSGARTCPAHGW